MCEPVCWNKKTGLYENCALDLDEEISAAQAQVARERVVEKTRSVDTVGQRGLAQVSAVHCLKCGASNRSGKFCLECGTALSARKKCRNGAVVGLGRGVGNGRNGLIT